MENFNIPEDPLYTERIRKFRITDPAHADLFNAVVQNLVGNDAFLKKALEILQLLVQQHTGDMENPHGTTAEQLNLDKVDNTSDMDKPVSNPVQEALDSYYGQLTAYVDKAITDLIGGAPVTLDTLKEIADAIASNQSVMDALDRAISRKANAAEFDSHVKDTTAHITTAERNKWNSKAEGSHTHDYAASGHTHNDRYYAKSVIDSKLSGKADSGHTHNYASSSHAHDDRYYTESEMDSKLNGKADSIHGHDYLPLTGGDLNGGVAMIPAGEGHGWLDIYYSKYVTGSYMGHYHNLSIFVHEVDAYVRADRGRLWLESASSDGIFCAVSDTPKFCPISASAFNVNSSRRYKENIVPIPDEDARSLLWVGIVSYDYKEGVVGDQSRYGRTGVIAEDVEKIIPEVVSYREIDGSRVPDSVDYSRFIPYLIRMVQLQQGQIEELQGQIRELQERISGQE